MKAGSFSKDENGVMRGKLHAAGIGFFDALFEERTDRDGKPYFKLIADPDGSPAEIGTAWPREKDGKTFYSVNIETTTSPNPLDLALFPDGYNAGKFNLVFDHDRQAPRA